MYKEIALTHYEPISDFRSQKTATVCSKGAIVASVEHLSHLKEDLRDFIVNRLNPDPSKFCYIVVNALSDEETFGDNVNGDAMPRETKYGDPCLISESSSHGYKTYQQKGKWFHHHNNKDPSKAAGDVLFSSYDVDQGLVRVLVAIDRSKDPETCAQIDAGKLPLTSMGLRVPFDICFTPDSLVKTNLGEVRIDSINEHIHSVVTHTGETHKVLRVIKSAQADDDIIEISHIGTYRKVKATKNHPILAVRKESARAGNGRRLPPEKITISPEWIDAENLRVGDYTLSPIIEPSTGGSVMLARLFGYFCGDGHRIIQKSGRKKDGRHKLQGLGFTCNISEVEHMRNIDETISSLSNSSIKKYVQNDRNAVYYRIYDQELARAVISACGTVGVNKIVPPYLFNASYYEKLYFLGGMIDTDGSQDHGTRCGSIRINGVNEQLMVGCRQLLIQCGIPAIINKWIGNGGSYSEDKVVSYAVCIPAGYSEILSKYSEKVTSYKKRNVSSGFFWTTPSGNKYYATPISGIKKEKYSGFVYNLSVDVDETYLVNGISVHNCSECDRIHGTRDKVERWIHEWYTDLIVREKYVSPGDYVLMHNSEYNRTHGRNIPGLSRWTTEYCDHLKHSMGRTNRDGTKVFAINHLPSLFDISKVFINADKVSEGVMKVASVVSVRKPYAEQTYSATCEDGSLVENSMSKTAAVSSLLNFVKGGEEVKHAVIEKEAPTSGSEAIDLPPEERQEVGKTKLSEEFIDKVLAQLREVMLTMDMQSEPYDIPEDFINKSRTVPCGNVMSTMREMRIIPRPMEFQRMLLNGMGMDGYSDHLHKKNMCFDQFDFGSEVGQGVLGRVSARLTPRINSLMFGSPNEDMMEDLRPIMAHRSMMPTHYFPRARSAVIMLKQGSIDPAMLADSERFKQKVEDSREPMSVIETMGIAALAYPFLRNAAVKALNIPGSKQTGMMSPEAAAIVALTGLAGIAYDNFFDGGDDPTIYESMKTASELMKTAGLAEFLPWSENIAKAHLGALATMPAIHGYSMHQRRRAMRGEQIGDINKWVAMNPDILSLGYLAAGPSTARAAKGLIGKKLSSIKTADVFRKGANLAMKLQNKIEGPPEQKVKAPHNPYNWQDRALGSLTWALMAPTAALPTMLAGLVDGELMHKAFD